MAGSRIHDHGGITRDCHSNCDQHGKPLLLRTYVPAYTGHPSVVYGTILQQMLVWRLCAARVHLTRQAQLQVTVKEWITIRMNW